MNAIERKARELCEAAGGSPNRKLWPDSSAREWEYWAGKARRILAAEARDDS